MSIIQPNIKNILKEMSLKGRVFSHNHDMWRCMEDDLTGVARESFKGMSSDSAYANKCSKVVPLNYIKKIVNSLSTIYTFDVNRAPSSNQDLLDFYLKTTDYKTCMQEGNRYFNGLKSVLFEIYIKKNKKPGFRAIPSDRFFVYSTDSIDPNEPDIYIKLLGSCKAINGRWAEKYIAWSDDEWVEFDSTGTIRSSGVNPHGIAPFVYINRSKTELIPIPNYDMKQVVLSIVSVMTDAAVATFFQSFPIRILINGNLDANQLALNPDDILMLNTKPGQDLTPEFKELVSSLDVTKPIALATKYLTELLYCFDLTAQNDGASNGVAESGTALAIKATDLLDNKKLQIAFFAEGEANILKKMSIVHNARVRRGDVYKGMPTSLFAEDFEVEIEFALPSTEVQQLNAMNDNDNAQTAQQTTDTSLAAAKSSVVVKDTIAEEVV